mgnify:CR=1
GSGVYVMLERKMLSQTFFILTNKTVSLRYRYESWVEERFSRLNYLISMDRRVRTRPEYSVDSSDPVENHIRFKFDWRLDTSMT